MDGSSNNTDSSNQMEEGHTTRMEQDQPQQQIGEEEEGAATRWSLDRVRRRTLLMRVLFNHILRNRRERESSDDDDDDEDDGNNNSANNKIALNTSPLRVWKSHNNSITEEEVQCRFCFEGDEGEQNNPLIAPCNCTGASEWIHVQCLRRWQRQVQAKRCHGITASANINNPDVCSVCTARYLLPPPQPLQVQANVLRLGTLLVAKDDMSGGRTFHRTVIMLLDRDERENHDQQTNVLLENGTTDSSITTATTPTATTDGENTTTTADNNTATTNTDDDDAAAAGRRKKKRGSTYGIILNSPLHASPPQEEALLRRSLLSYPWSDNISIEFRRGGPVCGGRLGVVRYFVAHTLSIISHPENENKDPTVILWQDEEGQERRALSLPIPMNTAASHNQVLQLLYAEDRQTPQEYDRPNLLRCLTKVFQQRQQEQQCHHRQQEDRIIVFSGHCRWRPRQLEGEVIRGVWKVCQGTQDDAFRCDNALWQDISTSERILSWQDLMTDGEESENDILAQLSSSVQQEA